MNKNQSKYFNTAIKMNDALITLLDKKDFEYITVKEICETAVVNRSTFYLHYENTFDLLQETTENITNRFATYFTVDRQSITKKFETKKLKDLVFITPEYLLPYLSFIKENQKIFKTSLRHLNLMNFNQIYNKMFEFIFDPVLERFDFPKESRRYIMKFYLTGITAVVTEWLEKGCQETTEQIGQIITKCVLDGRKI